MTGEDGVGDDGQSNSDGSGARGGPPVRNDDQSVNYSYLVMEAEDGLDMLDGEAYREAAETIEGAADELMQLSETARTAQTEVGFNPSQQNRTDITELVEHLAVQFRRDYPDANIGLNLPTELIVNTPRSDRIAISELLENAIEHDPGEEVNVTIRIEAVGQEIRTIVEDECPPIPNSDRRAINEGRETPLVYSLGVGLWLAN